jgi:hypothetical protein
VTFVGDCAVFVVEFAEAVHFILFPLPVIMPAIFEIQNAVAATLVVKFVAFVTPSVRDIFFHVLKIGVILIGIWNMRRMINS